ncbi:hypothetical protein F2P56_027204 [Juglans regia]|uniref:Protein TRIGALACTOSYLDIACYLGLYCEROL 4, chloroplastic-like n=1 Tax=Juglans regia TaxID=51240 RepID=A0A833T3I7_JUGRE|nr:hypothetical protein F2P56_027204 [Juglans regia]
MKKLRWAMDGSFWDLDVSTPRTLDGLARPVPGDPIPLGLSRGTRLSRAKQLHFMQRFMPVPFVPSYAAASDGFALQRVLTVPLSENWFCTLLGQFNFQKFVSSLMKESGETSTPPPAVSTSSWLQLQLQSIGKHLRDKSLYALGFSSELLLTPDDTMLLSVDSHSFSHTHKKTPRKKAVLHHKVTLQLPFQLLPHKFPLIQRGLTTSLYVFQIAGPVSIRVDAGVAVDLKNRDWPLRVDEPIFAIEYALQVLGSAKAVAWYSQKHQELMLELRFFET